MLDGFHPRCEGDGTRGGLPFLALLSLHSEDAQAKLVDSLEENLVGSLLMGVVGDQPMCALIVPLLDTQVGKLVREVVACLVGGRRDALRDVRLVCMAFALRKLNSLPSFG